MKLLDMKCPVGLDLRSRASENEKEEVDLSDCKLIISS